MGQLLPRLPLWADRPYIERMLQLLRNSHGRPQNTPARQGCARPVTSCSIAPAVQKITSFKFGRQWTRNSDLVEHKAEVGANGDHTGNVTSLKLLPLNRISVTGNASRRCNHILAI